MFYCIAHAWYEYGDETDLQLEVWKKPLYLYTQVNKIP